MYPGPLHRICAFESTVHEIFSMVCNLTIEKWQNRIHWLIIHWKSWPNSAIWGLRFCPCLYTGFLFTRVYQQSQEGETARLLVSSVFLPLVTPVHVVRFATDHLKSQQITALMVGFFFVHFLFSHPIENCLTQKYRCWLFGFIHCYLTEPSRRAHWSSRITVRIIRLSSPADKKN